MKTAKIVKSDIVGSFGENSYNVYYKGIIALGHGSHEAKGIGCYELKDWLINHEFTHVTFNDKRIEIKTFTP